MHLCFHLISTKKYFDVKASSLIGHGLNYSVDLVVEKVVFPKKYLYRNTGVLTYLLKYSGFDFIM